MKKVTIAFAGGGSGGHVYPIRSLLQHIDQYEEFFSRVEHIVWFGSRTGLEYTTMQNLRSTLQHITLSFAPITSGKLRREKSLTAWIRNIVDIFFRLPRGILVALFYLRKAKVDIVFCKGGHVAGPVIFAARLLRLPLMVHESDTKPGLINKLAARHAVQTFTGFDNVFEGAVTVGQIMSSDMVYDDTKQLTDKSSQQLQTTLRQLATTDKTLVFVSGGSQGGRILYQELLQQVRDNHQLQTDYHFVIIWGFLNAEYFAQQTLPDNILALDYASQQEMAMCMYYSDIALVRGGTTTLAECKIYELPQIIVPLPITHDQKKNAEYYQLLYGDTVLDQNVKDFGLQLKNALVQYVSYHKKLSNTDRQQKINHAKNYILTELLNYKNK